MIARQPWKSTKVSNWGCQTHSNLSSTFTTDFVLHTSNRSVVIFIGNVLNCTWVVNTNYYLVLLKRCVHVEEAARIIFQLVCLSLNQISRAPYKRNIICNNKQTCSSGNNSRIAMSQLIFAGNIGCSQQWIRSLFIHLKQFQIWI